MGMRSLNPGFTIALTFLVTLVSGDFRLVPTYPLSQALAQTTDERKTQADQLLKQGKEQIDNDQYDRAFQSLQQALTIYRAIKDRQGEGRTLKLLAWTYYVEGDNNQAIAYGKQTLEIAQEIKDSDLESRMLLDLGVIYYYGLGDFSKTIPYFEKGLAIARTTQNREVEARALFRLGAFSAVGGESEKAIDFYEQALQVVNRFEPEKLIYRQLEADILHGLGAAYLGSQSELAIETYQQALAVAEGDRPRQITILISTGRTYFVLQQHDKAIGTYQQALTLARQTNNSLQQGEALLEIGKTYGHQSQYPKAIEYYQQALPIFQQNKYARSNFGEILAKIAEAYKNLGEPAKALEFYQQGLSVAREASDLKQEGEILANICTIYNQLGQYERALEICPQALETLQAVLVTAKKKNEIPEITTTGWAITQIYLQLTFAYAFLGQSDQAKYFSTQAQTFRASFQEYLASVSPNTTNDNTPSSPPSKLEKAQEQLAFMRSLGNLESEAFALDDIAEAYEELGQLDQALEYHQQALQKAQESRNLAAIANMLYSLGNFYDQQKQYDRAVAYYLQAAQNHQKTNDPAATANVLVLAGQASFADGKTEQTITTLTDAIAFYESLRVELSDRNKVSIFEQQANAYRLLQEALIIQNRPNEALEIAERGRARAFVELLASKLTNNSKTDLKITPPNLTQIQQIAQAQGATLVEYSLVGDKVEPKDKKSGLSKLLIWVIKPTGEVILRQVDLKSFWQQEQIALSNLVTSSRESIGVRGRGSLGVVASVPKTRSERQLQQLHQLLIAPIGDLLSTNPDDKVIFMPQGSLFLVPFAALQDTSGQYLIDKHTIAISPSIQVLQLTHTNTVGANAIRPENLRPRDILIVGNPTMPRLPTATGETSEQLPDLPGAEQEAIAIAQLFQTQAITGNQATKTAIVQQMPQAKIIHLATHGLLDDFKGLGVPGAIALAPSSNDNGLLTAGEILDLNLNAELVVLSACDTGRGTITGDGVIGLSRSLITAGVPSVLVSLWSVPDAPTAELMVEFYRQLQQNGDKSQALRQAMLKTKAKHPHPRNWAAFTLIGEAE